MFICPAGRTAIVRGGTLVNNGNLAQLVNLRLDPAGAAGAGPIFRLQIPGIDTAVIPYMVLNPGDAITVENAGAAAPIHSSGFGSLLLGAPE